MTHCNRSTPSASLVAVRSNGAPLRAASWQRAGDQAEAPAQTATAEDKVHENVRHDWRHPTSYWSAGSRIGTLSQP